MPRVFLSVGSNMGDRVQSLREAVARLRALSDVIFVDASPLYQTEPWEQRPGEVPDPEAWFFNCVVAIDTTLPARDLLAQLQEIEDALGRVRGTGTHESQRYEPRPLDIDILLYGDEVIAASDVLHVPHLLMHERGFVLRPLADLAPDIEHPILYQTIRELVAALDDEHEVRPSDLARRWFER
jgi:2-amino-4-hydroxy-6-hydroxymethyldihydropteridine diphosphokinase